MVQDLSFGITGINRSSPAFQSVRNDAVATAQALRLATFQTQNLSFQMQDLGQGLLSGQSPFRLIIQQGSQIAQIFNPGTGLAAALKATGASLMAFLLNPLNLAVLGFAAAAGGASLLFSKITGGSRDIKSLIEDHKRLIDEIGERYGKAALEAENFGEKSREALSAGLISKGSGLREQLSSELRGIGIELLTGGFIDPSFTGTMAEASRAAETFFRAILSGNADVIAFRQELARLLTLDPTNAKLLEFYNELIALTKDANDWTIELRKNTIATGLVTAEPVGRLLTGEENLQALRKFAMMFELPFEGPDRRDQRSQERAAQRIQDVIAGLQFEAEQLTRTNREQSIYNALKRAGVTLDSEWGQVIAANAGFLYDQRLALDQNIEGLDRMRGVGESILDSFSDSLRRGTSVWDAFAQAGLRALDQIIDRSLELAAIGLFGTPGTTQTGFLGAALGALLPGFQHGGSFTVGGPSGGGDRTLVAFRANRGERVSVGPQGRGGDGGEITVRILTDASPLLMQEVDVRSTRNAVSVVRESNRQAARRQMTHG